MELTEIIAKLNGRISPMGMADVDAERLENIKNLGDLVTELVVQLQGVEDVYAHSHEHSVQEIAKSATESLNQIKSIIN